MRKPKAKINLDMVRRMLSPNDQVLTAADTNRIHFGGRHTVVTPRAIRESEIQDNASGAGAISHNATVSFNTSGSIPEKQ